MQEVSIAMLTDPQLLGEVVIRSLLNVGIQSAKFAKIPENSIDDKTVMLSLQEFNSNEYSHFIHQRLNGHFTETQNSGREILSHLYLLTMIVSILLFILLYKHISPLQKNFFGFLIFFLLINSFICGVLTAPSD